VKGRWQHPISGMGWYRAATPMPTEGAGARVIGTASETTFGFLQPMGVEPVAYGTGLADRANPTLLMESQEHPAAHRRSDP